MIDFKSLVQAGVHFGHQTSRWCPKMAPYIWGYKNNIHLIDVSKTAQHLEAAAQFLQSIAAGGKQILWVGTKKPAQAIIQSVATRLDMPYVNHRWIGGTLSNYGQVKKSITKMLHYEDIIAKAEKQPYYTKKEINVFQKNLMRLKKNIDGIRNLQWPIGALVLVDVRKEQSALREASVMGIPVVAMVDTNGDPSLVNYVIPGNDDVPRSIKIIFDYLAEAVQKGKELVGQTEKPKKVEVAAEEEVQDVISMIVTDEEDEDVSLRKAEAAKKKAVVKFDDEGDTVSEEKKPKPVSKPIRTMGSKPSSNKPTSLVKKK